MSNPEMLREILALDKACLRRVRAGKRAARAAIREATRRAAILAHPPSETDYQVHHANAYEFVWPQNIDVICTDPPWKDMEAYRWLGEFSAAHLREGGLLLAQCGQHYLPNVLDILRGSLKYQWTLAMAYEQLNSQAKGNQWLNNWRPVLCFSKGKRTRHAIACDVFTVRKTVEQIYHEWQQPVEPFRYWLSRFSAPGSLICDPFAGSSSNGVAVKLLGEGRRYIGTEIDEDNALVAKKRIADTRREITMNPAIWNDDKTQVAHKEGERRWNAD